MSLHLFIFFYKVVPPNNKLIYCPINFIYINTYIYIYTTSPSEIRGICTNLAIGRGHHLVSIAMAVAISIRCRGLRHCMAADRLHGSWCGPLWQLGIDGSVSNKALFDIFFCDDIWFNMIYLLIWWYTCTCLYMITFYFIYRYILLFFFFSVFFIF